MNAKELRAKIDMLIEQVTAYDIVYALADSLRARAERDENDAALENASLLDRVAQNLNQS